MRKITTHHDGHGRTEVCEVVAVGNEGRETEGECHKYEFWSTVTNHEVPENASDRTSRHYAGYLQFQNGPFDTPGAIPGTLSVAVLAAMIDHLKAFTKGPLSDRETALAVTKLEEAAMWLRARADRRAAAGTLGTKQA